MQDNLDACLSHLTPLLRGPSSLGGSFLFSIKRAYVRTRSPSRPNRNEVLTWHGYSSLVQELLHVGNEVALKPCSALRIASHSGRSSRTVSFNEEVPDRFAIWHLQSRHPFLEL